MRAFIEHHEIFHLLEGSSVDPVVGNWAISQMMTVDWAAPRYICFRTLGIPMPLIL